MSDEIKSLFLIIVPKKNRGKHVEHYVNISWFTASDSEDGTILYFDDIKKHGHALRQLRKWERRDILDEPINEEPTKTKGGNK